MGVSDSTLLELRRTAAAAVGAPGHGKDVNLTLWLADIRRHRRDLAYSAHELPIVMWAQANWYSWISRSVLGRMVNLATSKVCATSRPWSVVRGPAAAFFVTCQRLSWVAASATRIITDVGENLDLAVDSPAAVRAAVRRAVSRWRFKLIDDSLPSLQSHGAGPVAFALARIAKHPSKPVDEMPNWSASCLLA